MKKSSKYLLLSLSLVACVMCAPAKATTLGELFNVQAASRSNADIGQRSLHKRRSFRRHYNRRPNRKHVPDEVVAEQVERVTKYRCSALATFTEPVDPIRYGHVNVSAWLSSVAPPLWTASIPIVNEDEYNELDEQAGG